MWNAMAGFDDRFDVDALAGWKMPRLPTVLIGKSHAEDMRSRAPGPGGGVQRICRANTGNSFLQPSIHGWGSGQGRFTGMGSRQFFGRASGGRIIACDDRVRVASCNNAAMVEEHHLVGEFLHRRGIVADEDDGDTFGL